MKIGFVINPIAGLGGSVGLKGTDGKRCAEAKNRGAVSHVFERASEALECAGDLMDSEFQTAGGSMGEDVLRKFTSHITVTYTPKDNSDNEDTKAACKTFKDIDLLIFVGGDGTARDIMDARQDVPVLGIPAGVKMHSSVFANTPKEAGDLLRMILIGGFKIRSAEIMDVDENALDEDRMSASLYGYLPSIEENDFMQSSKTMSYGASDEEMKKSLAEFFVADMEKGVLYILGTGSTVEAVGRKLGIDKTMLGVDIVFNGTMLGKDLSEKEILTTLDKHPKAKIVVTPIGSQGFIFGRGNQQISAKVIRRVGVENVIVIATPAKLNEIKCIKVDTGDLELDAMFKCYMQIDAHSKEEHVVKIEEE